MDSAFALSNSTVIIWGAGAELSDVDELFLSLQAANEHTAIAIAAINASVFFIFLSPVVLLPVSVQNYYTTQRLRCQL